MWSECLCFDPNIACPSCTPKYLHYNNLDYIRVVQVLALPKVRCGNSDQVKRIRLKASGSADLPNPSLLFFHVVIKVPEKAFMKLFMILKSKTIKGDTGLIIFIILIFLLWPVNLVKGPAH